MMLPKGQMKRRQMARSLDVYVLLSPSSTFDCDLHCIHDSYNPTCAIERDLSDFFFIFLSLFFL
jgi:hypothetical protein